ncbi:hypothetical protein AltI4_24190 [Alteromonas sp. I4]|nr:hypothetical protein AltI4_24190 [Alteromonas sp. I4]
MYDGLKKIGLNNFIGTEFFISPDNYDGRVPPEWRTQTRYENIPWSHSEAERRWSNIAYEGYAKKNAFLWDISKRISHQIRTVNESFKALAFSYRRQLSARVKEENIDLDSRFEDGYSSKIFDAFQHFLFDICSLRDYLSEFIFYFILSEEEKSGASHMTTTSRIYKKFFKDKEQRTTLRNYFKNGCSEKGWLNALGAYRDLVVHACPLSMAGGKVMLRMDSVSITGGKLLPQIFAPIPNNPEEITVERSSFQSFNSFESKVSEFFDRANDKHNSLDILTYAFEVMTNFSEFLWLILKDSPFKGKQITITEKDIVGDIRLKKR